MTLLVLLGCLLACLPLDSAGSYVPRASCPAGRLIGATRTSRAGREYSAFTAVPFAVPPLRQLRFMPPKPLEPWEGVLNATKDLPLCYQSGPNGYSGQEDCLYLNVYTPNVNASMPVLIYIYGGGWRNGSPGPPVVSKFFMDEDVVLVMPNYRLGPYGFLSTEDEIIPGNMGLKDMALAIEWTKQNIKHFGGDPKQLTAFGLSAGGASTHYLCSSPRTRGLLKGCVSESGVGGSFWSLSTPGQARTSAYKVANAVGCFGEGLLQCLQSKPPEEIIKTEQYLKSWTGEPLIIYGPVLERESDTAFLTKWPTDSNFPWLTGITSAEGILKSGALDIFYSNKSYEQDFHSNKEEILMTMLKINESKRHSVKRVYDRFFLDNSFLDGMEKLYSEALFVEPLLKQLSLHQGPKYFFLFNYTDGPSIWKVYTGKTPNITLSGAGHGDNIYYFFDTSFFPGHEELQPKHIELSKTLIKFWVNFAKHQHPSPEGNPDWPQAGDKFTYLAINNAGFEVKDYTSANEILEFWKGVF